MKADMPDEHPRDLRLDHHDPVWKLLGQAPLPQPDAWFAARTLARCRHVKANAETGWILMSRIWRWALGGGLGVSLAMALVVTQVHSTTHDSKQKKVQEAFAIVASLGADSDPSSTTSSSSWQDTSL